jgi:hypothetical protein
MPSFKPSSKPSLKPSLQPSRQPSRQPSAQPTTQPSAQPSAQPTARSYVKLIEDNTVIIVGAISGSIAFMAIIYKTHKYLVLREKKRQQTEDIFRNKPCIEKDLDERAYLL